MAEQITFCLVLALLCATDSEARVEKWPLLPAEFHLLELLAAVNNCCWLLSSLSTPCSSRAMTAASPSRCILVTVISCGGDCWVAAPHHPCLPPQKKLETLASVMPTLTLISSKISRRGGVTILLIAVVDNHIDGLVGCRQARGKNPPLRKTFT